MPVVQVRRADHVTIVVGDLDRAGRFYREILGLKEIERPAFGFPGLWFQADDYQVHMNVAGAEAGMAGLPDLGASLPARGLHFAFYVDSCDAAASQLREQGIEIVVGPRSRPDGWRQLYIFDPDHHLIELTSPPG